jgi:hypothetical protein
MVERRSDLRFDVRFNDLNPGCEDSTPFMLGSFIGLLGRTWCVGEVTSQSRSPGHG